MSKDKKVLPQGHFIEHKPCIASELKLAGVFRWGNQAFEDCGSSDANAIYEHDIDDGVTYSGYCHSCAQNFRPEHISKSSVAEELGMDTSGVVGERKEFVRKEKQEPLDRAKVKELMAKFPYLKESYRGIRSETLKFFGHLAEVGRDGKVKAFYYPETRSGGWPVGYKIRFLPKYFSKIGQTGLKSDLAGQCKFNNSQNARDVLLVGGEIDLLSAFQMLRDNQISKNQSDYAPIPVVSPTTGEGSAAKQVAAQYEFFDQFENIYIGLDNDEAGQEATLEVIKVLPKDKVKVVAWSAKDPNAMLMAGKQKQFMSDFWRAKEVIPSELQHSANALDEAKEFLNSEKIKLPPAFHRLQDNMRGGIKTTGAIVNLIGDTSIGKCHGKGTKVWNYDGNLVNVEDVKEGDLLMGPDGTPRTVLNTTVGYGKLYQVEQGRGISYIVNDKHVLSLRAGYDCKASNILKGDIVNIPVEEYKNEIGSKLRRSLKGYKADLVNLGSNATKVFEPHMIGLWLADGTSIDSTVTFNKKDHELLAEFESFCERNNYKMTTRKGQDRSNCIGLNATKGFIDKLRELGIFGNKHIPDAYLKASYEDRVQLLSGLLDGDGYLCFRGYEITQKNVRLAKDIVYLARTLGLDVTIKDKFSKCQDFEGTTYQRIHIYGDTSKLKLKLERKRVEDKSDTRRLIDTAINVEDFGEGGYYGFMLDGDHLYCLEDFTVTHNSLFTDALLYYWFWESPLVPTIVSLERTTGELTVDFLSMHLKNNLSWFKDGADALAILNDPDNAEVIDDLLMKDSGESRYHVLDDRSGTPSSLKACVERAVAQYGSRLIIFDPLTDFLRSLSIQEQEDFMMWEKQKKKEGIVFINVLHTRKPSPDKDGNIRKVTEYDALGSGTFVQSADTNMVINRDKMSKCPVARNTTTIDVPKVRGGTTGHGGDIYYDYKERALYDLLDHMSAHPEIEATRIIEDVVETKGNFRVGKQPKASVSPSSSAVETEDGVNF